MCDAIGKEKSTARGRDKLEDKLEVNLEDEFEDTKLRIVDSTLLLFHFTRIIRDYFYGRKFPTSIYLNSIPIESI